METDYYSVQRHISERMKILSKKMNPKQAREEIVNEYKREYPDIKVSWYALKDTRTLSSQIYQYLKTQYVPQGDTLEALFSGNDFVDSFLASKELPKFHRHTINFTENIDKKVVDKFIDLLKKADDARFLFKCTDTNGKEYHFRLNNENIEFIRELLLSGGIYEKFSSAMTGSDIDWLTDSFEMASFEIIDIDQLPPALRKYHIRAGGAFDYQLTSEQTDLERYQLYPMSAKSIPKMNCFVYALEQSGKVDATTMNSIKYNLKDIPVITPQGVEKICEKFNIGVTLVFVYAKGCQYQHYGRHDMDIRIALFHEHYFLVDELQYNCRYLQWRNDPRLKDYPEEQKYLFKSFYDEEKHCKSDVPSFFQPRDIPIQSSVKIFRNLFNMKGALAPINKELLTETAITPIADTCPADFRLYSSESENIVSKFYASIPDLYQISGNTEAYIRQCLRGGRVFIYKNKLHIHEAVMDLDINSLYPYAMSLLFIQKGKCKHLPEMSFESLAAALFDDGQVTKTKQKYISQAFMQIYVESARVQRHPDIVEGLSAGNTYFVDAITLLDLIKYNGITGRIIEGLYYDGDRDYSIKPFIESLYAQRKTNPEMKLVMNKMSGYTLKKTRATKPCEVKEDMLKFILKNMPLFDSASGNEAMMYKKFTNQYNMANFGVYILSMARHIMNEVIYTSQDNGATVLYSDTDSIFIRAADIDKITYPIGSNLGELSNDFEDGYTQASEAIFLSKKRYICKLDEDKYHFRYAGLSKEKIKTPWNMFVALLNKV